AVIGMPDVRLINMSFGGPSSIIESEALDRAAAAGKIMVAASGNDGAVAPNQPNYPAAHPLVIGVGASTAERQVAAYSQQAAVDIVAPGGSGAGDRHHDIAVLSRLDAVSFASGTSFAAPYVTGALSLWLAGNRDATVEDARRALQAAAVDIQGTTADGAGVLDVGRLLAPVDVPAAPSFTDTGGSTHEAAIEAVAGASITGGYSDGTFRPGANVTRGQMAAFLARALDLSPGPGGTFGDVTGSTHEAAIEAVAGASITGGYSDGTFRPGANVTRGQMAAFIARALSLL
ncbi:MAG: S-layer homology domain-containing protein, partial [Dehalococcoidia bacterium]